jgi:hypothetical protein
MNNRKRTPLPDDQRCVSRNVEGRPCTLARAAHGDGTLCGVHFHAARRARKKTVASLTK